MQIKNRNIHRAFIGIFISMAISTAVQAKDSILVIGAGFSGLAAANKLYKNGYEVTVLEARDRIGGRIFTDRSLGFPLDMGASWIHDNGNDPVYELAKTLGISISKPTDYVNAKSYSADGKPDPIKAEDINSFYEEVADYAKFYKKDLYVTGTQMIAEMHKDNYFPYVKSQQQLDFLTSMQMENEYAADADSLRAAAPWEGDDVFGDDVLLPNGYDEITNHLSADINIKLNTIVKDIDYTGQQIVVNTSKGIFRADKVVVTLPIGVLKAGDVSFTPDLPNYKRNAIDKIGSGSMIKVWLVFSETFWDSDKTMIGYISDERSKFTTWFSFKEELPNVLLSFNSGSYAKILEGKTDQQITDSAMIRLKAMYGNDIPNPTDVKISRWSSDPFSKGAYSYLKTGASFQQRENLRKSVNKKLFFAGEATSVSHPLTTEGAYITGIQAADEIIALAP